MYSCRIKVQGSHGYGAGVQSGTVCVCRYVYDKCGKSSAGKMGSEGSKRRKEVTGSYCKFRYCQCMYRRRRVQLLPGDRTESGRSPRCGCGWCPHRLHRCDRQTDAYRETEKRNRSPGGEKAGFTGERNRCCKGHHDHRYS